jgi:glycine cleavage system regulatory protein|nr:ACT domain-containing protein [Candidatus Krumholzibacteria bacterium]
MTQLVITIVGDDRPGIVENLAAVVADHDGNWLSSSMSNLAGQFAGIIEIAVDDARRDDLSAAISNLPGLQVHSVVGSEPTEVGDLPMAELEVVGVDQPGIVRKLTGLLKSEGVSLLQFASWTEAAPNSGDELFRAVAEFELPATVNVESLKAKLEELAEDMAVDIELGLDEED